MKRPIGGRLWRRHHHPAQAQPRYRERGDTLIEVLFAVVIIAIGATALLGALTTSLTGSGEHRSLAALDSLLRGYGEAAKYQIQLQPANSMSPPPPPLYSDSASAATYYSAKITFSMPVGYAGWAPPVVSCVRSWNPSSKNFDPSCSPISASGIQLLTLSAKSPSKISDSLQIVVRNPLYSSAYAGKF
jgi:prepilin-type N-terminal cleavage/methylation domain-containing protein